MKMVSSKRVAGNTILNTKILICTIQMLKESSGRTWQQEAMDSIIRVIECIA